MSGMQIIYPVCRVVVLKQPKNRDPLQSYPTDDDHKGSCYN
jgi:hypothetical protein